jgi:hypothetical protein
MVFMGITQDVGRSSPDNRRWTTKCVAIQGSRCTSLRVIRLDGAPFRLDVLKKRKDAATDLIVGDTHSDIQCEPKEPLVFNGQAAMQLSCRPTETYSADYEHRFRCDRRKKRWLQLELKSTVETVTFHRQCAST